MAVAEPYQAVTLDAVPQIILQAEVACVGTHVKNFIDKFIVAAEGAEIIEVAVGKRGKHGFEPQCRFLIQRLEVNKTEARFAPRLIAHALHRNNEFAGGVVVARVFHAHRRDRLARRFAEADQHFRVTAAGAGTENAHTAVKLSAEIEQDPRLFGLVFVHKLRGVVIGNIDLIIFFAFQKMFGVLNIAEGFGDLNGQKIDPLSLFLAREVFKCQFHIEFSPLNKIIYRKSRFFVSF